MTRAHGWMLVTGVFIVAAAITFYFLVVRAPIVKAPTGPIPSLSGLSRAEAVAAAQLADDRPELHVDFASAGPAGALLPPMGVSSEGVPSEETLVWLVGLSSEGPGQSGSRVVIDYLDGTIYSVQKWIS
jgi:hypothetical protein